MTKLGLLLSSWRDPSQSEADQIALLLGRAQAAADVGFTSIWANQRILADPWPATDTTALISRVAAIEGDIEFGGVYLFPLMNPVRMAETVLSLMAITGQRFTVAGALGWRPAEFELMGVPIRERLARFTEVLGLLRVLTDPSADDRDIVARWPELGDMDRESTEGQSIADLDWCQLARGSTSSRADWRRVVGQ